MTATATAAKFTLTTEDGDTKTYSRKIDAMTAHARLEDEGITARVTSPKGVVVVDTIEADEDDEVEVEDGQAECPECGEVKDETAFPTVAGTKNAEGVVGPRTRNLDECRSCRNDRLATGGRKIPGVCTVACRQSDGDHDEKSCQCICGGAGHGSEAVHVAA